MFAEGIGVLSRLFLVSLAPQWLMQGLSPAAPRKYAIAEKVRRSSNLKRGMLGTQVAGRTWLHRTFVAAEQTKSAHRVIASKVEKGKDDSELR